MDDALRNEDYATLATFRQALRRFLHFSENAAIAAGLTAQQHQALLAIRAAPDGHMLVGELAEHLMLRPHSSSGLVNRLEKLKLVARVPGDADRRQVRIVLTQEGEEVLASLTAAHRAELRRLRPLLADLLAQI